MNEYITLCIKTAILKCGYYFQNTKISQVNRFKVICNLYQICRF